jgi:PTS system ascorbate-specific IIA component
VIGFLLITHEQLGHSLMRCVEHVLGGMPPQLACVAVMPADDPADVEASARKALSQVDKGSGAIVFTDIAGATPYNVACRLVTAGRVEGISGVNLPMLLRGITYREGPLAEVRDKTVAGGISGVVRF